MLNAPLESALDKSELLISLYCERSVVVSEFTKALQEMPQCEPLRSVERAAWSAATTGSTSHKVLVDTQIVQTEQFVNPVRHFVTSVFPSLQKVSKRESRATKIEQTIFEGGTDSTYFSRDRHSLNGC